MEVRTHLNTIAGTWGAIHKTSIFIPLKRLRICSHCFQHVILHEGHPARVAESTHIILCAGLEGLAKEATFAITLASLFFMEFMNSVSTCFFFKNVWS